MEDESLQTEINQNIQQEVDILADNFRSYIDEDERCIASTDLHRVHLEIDPCMVTFVEDEIASMKCTSILFGRAVYPISTTVGINFNLETGEFYSFNDLFDEEYDYGRGVAVILREENNLNDFDLNLIPNIEEDTIFYIDSECPLSSMDSNCLAIPTNGTSGASRGIILFADIASFEGNLSSERIVEVLLN